MIGTVYKIEIGEKIYIGSTIKKLNERQRLHNIRLNQNIIKYKLYEECRKHNVAKIICIPLKELEIEDELEIRELEQEYIDELKPSLNHRASYTGLTGLTQEEYNQEYHKEYREKNKEILSEKKKQYYENNKETLLEQCKQYRKNNVELIRERKKQDYIKNKEHYLDYQKEYQQNNKDKIRQQKKEYEQNNKDKIREQKKEYRKNNIEKIREQKKVDITCPICGHVGRKDKLNRHQETKKCLAASVREI